MSSQLCPFPSAGLEVPLDSGFRGAPWALCAVAWLRVDLHTVPCFHPVSFYSWCPLCPQGTDLQPHPLHRRVPCLSWGLGLVHEDRSLRETLLLGTTDVSIGHCSGPCWEGFPEEATMTLALGRWRGPWRSEKGPSWQPLVPAIGGVPVTSEGESACGTHSALCPADTLSLIS